MVRPVACVHNFTVVHTGYHPLRNGDPFLPPTAPIGTGTGTSTSRYQITSFIGQRGVDGAAARAINMGRSRTRSRYIRRFLSKARGWLSVCSLLRTNLRTSFSRFGLSSSSRSLLPTRPIPSKSLYWGTYVLNACFTCIFCSLHVLRSCSPYGWIDSLAQS